MLIVAFIALLVLASVLALIVMAARTKGIRRVSAAGLALMVLMASGFAGSRLMLPVFHNYEFQDALNDIARRHSYTQITDDDIRALVIQQAAKLDIRLDERQIVVTRGPDGLSLEARYTVQALGIPLEFSVRSLDTGI